MLRDNSMQGALAACRRVFVCIGLFSLAINMLMLTAPLYMMQVFDRVITTQGTDTLIVLTLLAGLALLVMAALDMARMRLMVRLGSWFDSKLASDVLESGVFSALRGKAGAGSQGLRDLANLRGFFSGGGILPLLDAPWMPIFLGIIFLMNPLLGWIAFGGAGLLFGLALGNEMLTRRPLLEGGEASTRALNDAQSLLRNADVIAAMGMLPNLMSKWRLTGGRGLAHQGIAAELGGDFSAIAKVLRLSLQIAMMAAGAWLVTLGELSPGAMIASSIILSRALAPVEQAITAWKGVVSARAAYHRLNDLLDAHPASAPAMALPKPQGRLEVEAVTFTPPGGERPILRQVAFSLEPGEALGILGPTACGKTTLARLLVGSQKPSSGCVRLDSAEMAVWNAADRGPHVGYLPQDIELFNGSVRENIARMGDGPDEAVIAAAQMAGVHEMILSLPKGYETPIGEQGEILSGGQRQRIGLARAVYGDPRLVVLDEPNSNLDVEGEQALIRAVEALRVSGATVIMIVHRTGVLARMNKILVLREGQVDLFGDRDEVMPKLLRPTAVNTEGETQAPYLNLRKGAAR